MTYYKVPAGHDIPVYAKIAGWPGRYKLTRALVQNELYTAKECRRYGINPDGLQPVNLSPRRVYWFFGARFECKGGPA